MHYNNFGQMFAVGSGQLWLQSVFVGDQFNDKRQVGIPIECERNGTLFIHLCINKYVATSKINHS